MSSLTLKEMERGWVEFHCPDHGFLVACTANATVVCKCRKRARRRPETHAYHGLRKQKPCKIEVEDSHKPEEVAKNVDTPPSPTPYPSAAVWEKLTFRIARRDHYKCQRCERPLRKRQRSFHHIIPRAKGGPNTEENLILLCRQCHDWVEVQEPYLNRPQIIGSFEEAA